MDVLNDLPISGCDPVPGRGDGGRRLQYPEVRLDLDAPIEEWGRGAVLRIRLGYTGNQELCMYLQGTRRHMKTRSSSLRKD